ncbi:DNA-binding transcriptional regulator [Ramlibacter sp. AW1]|uniref:DNA-binding transcriptional regulator n=1 Tax=Ramlibacter aurantiacus TaxID=2801330 RepID=A0A936ZFE4_9BURK|nr:DNA-binding transcriptional regulator [Ramlibacter aurantiacus]MBL0419922.1 DNA-binding transcriptional regulator [Ramlibacter aurantiacus]
MATARPINVVLRALQILRALNQQPVSSVDAIHKHTGIPKPTIVRLLQTLEADGLVRRAPQYGAYYLTSQVTALASGYHSEPRIVEASAAIADALTQELKWPVSVAVPDGDAMIVRYSTIPNSPLSFFHSTINMRLSLLNQALGRAFLAFCEPTEQQALLELLARTSGEPIVGHEPSILQMLAQVRERGYALRDPRVRPESSTIAVPIIEGARVVATIGLTWFSSALDTTQAVTRFLPPLQQAAQDISRALAATAT